MSHGSRESHWLVIRRCLAILCCVQRGSASWEELVQAVVEQEGSEAYGRTDGPLLRRRLENDLRRIREHLMVDLRFDREMGCYAVRDVERPLLDLPDGDLATVAWLEQTFGPDTPQHQEVHALLERLRLYLAPQRRERIEQCRTALALDLGQRDDDDISAQVWEGLTRALTSRRRIEFSYSSPQRTADSLPRHVVDPYTRYFDTARGHYYLRGWCHSTKDEGQRQEQRCAGVQEADIV